MGVGTGAGGGAALKGFGFGLFLTLLPDILFLTKIFISPSIK
jgi:hypothetical protein